MSTTRAKRVRVAEIGGPPAVWTSSLCPACGSTDPLGTASFRSWKQAGHRDHPLTLNRKESRDADRSPITLREQVNAVVREIDAVDPPDKIVLGAPAVTHDLVVVAGRCTGQTPQRRPVAAAAAGRAGRLCAPVEGEGGVDVDRRVGVGYPKSDYRLGQGWQRPRRIQDGHVKPSPRIRRPNT